VWDGVITVWSLHEFEVINIPILPVKQTCTHITPHIVIYTCQYVVSIVWRCGPLRTGWQSRHRVVDLESEGVSGTLQVVKSIRIILRIYGNVLVPEFSGSRVSLVKTIWIINTLSLKNKTKNKQTKHYLVAIGYGGIGEVHVVGAVAVDGLGAVPGS